MSKSQAKTLIFYKGDPNDEAGQRGVCSVTAAKLVVALNYLFLRDAKGELVATITWPGDVKVREI